MDSRTFSRGPPDRGLARALAAAPAHADDTTCRLLGTRVDANVEVQPGALLTARGVRPRGGQHPGRPGRRRQDRQGSRRGSDVQLFTNDGAFVVVANRVDGNLQCKSNTPAPTGGSNVVQGNKEDQCRAL